MFSLWFNFSLINAKVYYLSVVKATMENILRVCPLPTSLYNKDHYDDYI